MKTSLPPRAAIALSLISCAATTACSEDQASIVERPSTPADTGNRLGPVYALQYLVYTDDEPSSYVVLTDTLDLRELSLERAREYPGYAFVSTVNGQLLVSDGESPIITRYDIEHDLEWTERDRLSFANQGLSGGGAGFERHWFLDEHTAYLTLEVTQRVVWDPSELTIRGVLDDSALELTRDGLRLDATFNRQPRRLNGPVRKPFYYRDEDWFEFGPTTLIAIYDPVTHQEANIVELPCPALEVTTQDEAGNTYFSGWTYGPTLSLFGEGPAPCVRRLKPDNTLDEAWAPDLSAWTGGRPVLTFRYMADGKALGTVLHTDEVDVDFSAGYNEEAALELDNHWRLWLFDLNEQSAQPIEGVPSTGSGFHWARFGDRTFVLAPNEDWTHTHVFEVDGEGNASERFETLGTVTEFLRVR